MKRHVMMAWMVLAGLGSLASLGRANVTLPTFNYQGQLTDLNGLPQSGTFTLTFNLFDAASGGNQIAVVPVGAPGTAVTNGLFDVELSFSVSSTAMVNSPMWLEVTVGVDKLSPRKQILSSMFATNSSYLQGYVPGANPGDLPIIQANGRLAPAVISAPFPLAVTGTGSGYAIYAQNQNVVAGQAALIASGYDGVSATSAAGVGVYGASSSIGGIGVKAEQNSSSSVALAASNSSPSGLAALLGGGGFGLGLNASNTALNIGGTVGGQSMASPATGINILSNGTGVSINNTGGGNGLSSTNTNNSASVYGKNTSASGIGIFGEHATVAASGFGIGVQGQSNSTGGKGLQGLATENTGSNFGVYGSSASPNGFGIYGTAPDAGVEGNASDSDGRGVQGLALGDGGNGVLGEATGGVDPDGNDAAGVYGSSAADSSAGVYGTSPGYGVSGFSSGLNADSVGVYGESALNGVLGEADQGSGSNAIGVIGRSFSPQGVGVYGEISASGAGSSYGVWGRAVQPGGSGTGVYGYGNSIGVEGVAPGTGGVEYGLFGSVQGSGDGRYGVYGSVDSASAEDVYGMVGQVNGAANAGTGVYGIDNFPSGHGMHAYNRAAQDSTESGYAMGVTGRLNITEDNAGVYSGSAVAATSWSVTSAFCGANDVVLVFPAMNISAVNSPNSLWVASVHDGGFIVSAAQQVSSIKFYYLIIAK